MSAVGKGRKKFALKVIHPPFLKTWIKAQMATPAPPLGPQLGQRGINVPNFCKEFNKQTSHITPGAPCPTRIYVNPDRTFRMEISLPTSMWILKQCAGINRGASGTIKDEIVGMVSIKHIYEIAKVKSQDSILVGVPLEKICRGLITTCIRMGIKVVRDLDPDEYQKFLDERRVLVVQYLKEVADLKAAKMLRTTV